MPWMPTVGERRSRSQTSSSLSMWVVTESFVPRLAACSIFSRMASDCNALNGAASFPPPAPPLWEPDFLKSNTCLPPPPPPPCHPPASMLRPFEAICCSDWYTASTFNSMFSCFSSIVSLLMMTCDTFDAVSWPTTCTSLTAIMTCAICSEIFTMSACICCIASLMAPIVAPGAAPETGTFVSLNPPAVTVPIAPACSLARLFVSSWARSCCSNSRQFEHTLRVVSSKNLRMSHSLNAMRAIFGLFSACSACKNSSSKLRNRVG
mmetsp:Transcript_5166/g.20043  ORF Transcript_5166/g.20043 Transcript_5166/m.20043 type:complete len:264 (-) Transcript_5166:1954-2745(-)